MYRWVLHKFASSSFFSFILIRSFCVFHLKSQRPAALLKCIFITIRSFLALLLLQELVLLPNLSPRLPFPSLIAVESQTTPQYGAQLLHLPLEGTRAAAEPAHLVLNILSDQERFCMFLRLLGQPHHLVLTLLSKLEPIALHFANNVPQESSLSLRINRPEEQHV